MFVDARTLDDDYTIESDVCIVGGGPAGITIARSLAKAGKKVTILEGGDLEPSEAMQELYKGKASGLLHDGYLWMSRIRAFGGSTNRWGGFCAPLTEQDFEKRDWIEHSGWPITKKELDPYYKQAQEVLSIGPYEYDYSYWRKKNSLLEEFPGNNMRMSLWQNSRVNFGKKYLHEMKKSKNISTYLNANVVNIEYGAHAPYINRLDIKTLDGKKLTAHARQYVLACGGIENARLLMLSNKKWAGYFADTGDNIGGFFMDHPHTIAAKIMFSDKRFYSLTDKFYRNGTRIYPNLVTTKEVQEKEKLLSSAFTISHEQSDWQSITNVKSAQDVWVMMQRAANRKLRKDAMVTRLFGFMEQSPNPASRLTLADDKDALGLNRVQLKWDLNRLDRHNLERTFYVFAKELGKFGLGRIKIDDWIINTDGWPKGNAEGDDHKAVTGHAHHMGTTRMSEIAKKGVVDKNCQAHEVYNLYIAGSSVFPTGGWSNPTLTIVAMSLRLAEHLKSLKND